jgi:hypothetical protein
LQSVSSNQQSSLSLSQALQITGSLSNTSKMPGYSTSTPAQACITGAKLRKIEGSVCEKCYAFKGNYARPNVRRALEKRLAGIQHPRWVEAMVVVIEHHCRKCPYFRWHDSGDIQSLEHLKSIAEIARLLPRIKFWIPTRERQFVKRFLASNAPPKNLVIQVSDPLICEPRRHSSRSFANTSGVAPRMSAHAWRLRVKENCRALYHCPASQQDGQCKKCRACWDRRTKHVVFLQH